MEALLATGRVVVAEIYPRAAYSTALLDVPPPLRPPLMIPKTDACVRRRAVEALRQAAWISRCGVTLQDLDAAEASEDAFDACLTSAALLRCVLEGWPLHPVTLHAESAEGGMLGTGSVNLTLAARSFLAGALMSARPDAKPRTPAHPDAARAGTDLLRCPIPGCAKVWPNGRGGWDGHVGAARVHPWWHPTVTDPEARKRLFRAEFPEFFR